MEVESKPEVKSAANKKGEPFGLAFDVAAGRVLCTRNALEVNLRGKLPNLGELGDSQR